MLGLTMTKKCPRNGSCMKDTSYLFESSQLNSLLTSLQVFIEFVPGPREKDNADSYFFVAPSLLWFFINCQR